MKFYRFIPVIMSTPFTLKSFERFKVDQVVLFLLTCMGDAYSKDLVSKIFSIP